MPRAFSILVEMYTKDGRPMARGVLFEHDHDGGLAGAKSVLEIVECEREGAENDYGPANRWLRIVLRSQFPGTLEQFRYAWNTREVVDLDKQPPAAPGRAYKDELIDHVFELLTLAPIKRVEIIDILEAVKAKVAAIPTKEVTS